MITETYLEGKFIKERNIDLLIFEDRLNNFKEDNDFTEVKICTQSSTKRGVSFTFTNRVKVDSFKLHSFNGRLVIEFEELKNAITLNEDANVCLDLLHSRVLFRDFGISIYFC